MASQHVITALESLHLELEKLQPLIKHAEAAQQVTEMVKVIPQKYMALVEELKDNDSRFKKTLVDLFSSEIASISVENKKVTSNTIEIQQSVNAELESLNKLMEMVKAFHERVERINFPERLDKLDANIAGIMAAVQAVQSRLDSLERNLIDRLRDFSEQQKNAQETTINNIELTAKKTQNFAVITWALLLFVSIVLGIFLWLK